MKKIDFQLCFMYQHSVNIKNVGHTITNLFFLTFYTLINKSSKYKTFLNIWFRCDIIEMGKKVKDGQRYFYAD